MKILVRLAALALFTPLQIAGAAPADLDDVLDRATRLHAEDRVIEALEVVIDEVRRGAEELRWLSGEDASLRADELEVAVALAGRWARGMGSPAWLEAELASLEVAPVHGALHARLAWSSGTEFARLAPLVDWQLCGPFDNERGQGMLTATPAELDPGGTSYEGKVREVAWRPMPGVVPANGVLRLRRLFDPHAQSAILLRTWIESEAEREVLLLLGASEEVKVWCGGEPVLEALGSHSFSPDAFGVRLSLKAGWNELMVKVGSLDGSPTLVARLADPTTASPLVLRTSSSLPEGEPLLVSRQIPATSERVIPPGARTRYAEGDEAETLWRRALLFADAPGRPDHLRPGYDEARRASAAPESAAAALRYDLLALDLIRVRGASRVEEDVNPWLRLIDAALAEHGELPRLLRMRARHAWQNQPTYARAVSLLRRARAANPRSVPVRMELAGVLSRMGQEALSEALERELLQDREIQLWPGYSLRLSRLVPHGEERDQLVRAAIRSGEGEAIESLAATGRLAGDRSAASTLEVLSEKLSHHPWSTSARRVAAKTLISQGHPRDALAVLADALELAPERAVLHALRARAHLALGETELAISALEDELAVNYADDDERRLLEHLQSLGTSAFHDPFLEPLADVLARRADDPPVEEGVASREVLLHRIVIEVNPDGTAKRYHRTVERILSEAGARELDRKAWRAWPGEEEVRVLSADVLHPDGTVDSARTGRTGARGVLGIDLPPLQVGDVVDLEWRRDDLALTYFGNYFGFQSALSPDLRLPVRESEILLIAPASFPLHLHQRSFDGEFRTTEREDGSLLHHWRVTNLEPRVSENLMPPSLEDAPLVQASSYASWTEFGAWWWNLIEDEIRVSPEMAEKVVELVEGCETPGDRLRAIYDFVVTDIRYNAWEFGVHGYQPYSAPVIFSRRFGDCKDKAILLRAMLSEVGIEAWPVLIRADGRRFEEDHTLALVQHFNHCIAYIPEQEGVPEMYLDGTARFHPLEVLPDSDSGARVVVVRSDSVSEERIPFPAAEENRLEEVLRIDLTVDGPPLVELSRRASGRWDPRERSRFSGSDEQREQIASRLMGGLFGALSGEIEASYSDSEDLSEPVNMRLKVRAEKISRTTSEGFELPTSFDRLELLRTTATETTRESDLLLDVPWSRERRLEYVLGEGQSVEALPEKVEVETEDARYVRRVEATATGVEVIEEFSLHTHRVPRERYTSFRELCRAVDEAQGAPIQVEVAQ